MKKIISLVLAVSMVLSMFVSAFAATKYPDLVGENYKYAAAVDALTELKVINGFPDGEFKPEKELTRAELAKMLVICMGLGDQVDALQAKTVFSDVAASHWAAGYINAAAQSKIINGYPDGEFKPEKNVTYAEAFTMCLRALGYGNVVDSEGTWPVAYMLKAVELELTKDMDNVTAYGNATRGNTAILLWNMLRTAMWRITEESEKNGMTLSDAGDRIMLNVKFPDYWYYKDVYLDYVEVTDKDDVEIGIFAGWDDDFDRVGVGHAKADGIDLTKLVPGMKLSALCKDYRDDEKATFLTITPANTIVSGFMTDYKWTEDKATFKVDGSEYRFDIVPAEEAFATTEENRGDVVLARSDYYIQFESDGKKVKNWILLPTEYTYLETQSVIDGTIGEDDLVILDGAWADVDDVEVGAVVTELDLAEIGLGFGSVYAVNSKSAKATFDVMFYEREDWDDPEYVSLDDKDNRIVYSEFEAYEGEKNTKIINNEKLEVKIKDNDYAGDEVEVFYNYLGIPVRMHFGDADKNAKNAGFYAVTSNGTWGEGSNKGQILNIEMVGQDGVEEEYKTTTNATILDEIDGVELLRSNRAVYNRETEDGEPLATFVWVKFDDKNEKMETVIVLDGTITAEVADEDVAANPEEYEGKYDIIELPVGTEIDGSKLINGEDTLEWTVAKSAYFYESSATKDEKGNVNGFDVKVSKDRDEYDGVELPEGTLIAVKDGKAKYVFIPGESESNLLWGKLESINTSKETVSITGESAKKLSSDKDSAAADAAKGDLVGYTVNKAGDTVKIVEVRKTEDLSDGIENWFIVDGNADSEDAEDDEIPVFDGKVFAEDEKDQGKRIKKYDIVVVTLKKDKDTHEVSVVSTKLATEKGFDGLQASVRDWDRFQIDDDLKTVFVYTGVFDRNASIEDGVVGNSGPVESPDSDDSTGSQSTQVR